MPYHIFFKRSLFCCILIFAFFVQGSMAQTSVEHDTSRSQASQSDAQVARLNQTNQLLRDRLEQMQKKIDKLKEQLQESQVIDKELKKILIKHSQIDETQLINKQNQDDVYGINTQELLLWGILPLTLLSAFAGMILLFLRQRSQDVLQNRPISPISNVSEPKGVDEIALDEILDAEVKNEPYMQDEPVFSAFIDENEFSLTEKPKASESENKDNLQPDIAKSSPAQTEFIDKDLDLDKNIRPIADRNEVDWEQKDWSSSELSISEPSDLRWDALPEDVSELEPRDTEVNTSSASQLDLAKCV